MSRTDTHVYAKHAIYQPHPDPLSKLWAVSNHFANVPEPCRLRHLGLALVRCVFDEQGLEDGRKRRDQGQEMGEQEMVASVDKATGKGTVEWRTDGVFCV